MPSLSSKSTELFTKAEQAFELRNHDYAVLLYRSVLDASPDWHPARYKLHFAAWKSAAAQSPSPWQIVLTYLRVAQPYAMAHWKMRKGDWFGAVQAWEQCLALQPMATSFHLGNAKCLECLGWAEAALDEYRILRDIEPGNTTPIWELARLYSADNRWDNAREAYEAIAKLSPNDTRVASELRKIAAIHTIERGGWQDNGSYRDKLRDERQAKLLEQQERFVKNSPDKDSRWEEMERAIERKRSEALANPADAAARAEWEKLLADYRAALLADKKVQVAQYPTNLLLRFDLGELYLAAGQVDEAIGEFQKAVKNPSKKAEAQKSLGQCFHRKRLYALAVEQLAAACESVHEMTAFKKELLYELASVYEAMGKSQEAKREFEKIYAADIGFKDVAKKVEG